MLNSVLTVATQVWILFALIGVGALARKLKLVTEPCAAGMANVLLLIVTPCLMVDAFQLPFDASLLHQLGYAFAFSSGLHVVLIVLANLLFRARDDATPVLRLATVFSNAGFMGLPLEQALFGSRGVIFGVVYVATFNLFIWSWGLWEVKRERGRVKSGDAPVSPVSRFASFLSLPTFLNPGTVGLTVALGLFLARIRLPTPVAEPVRLLSLLNTPLAMIVIGFHLAGAKFGAILRRPSAWGAIFLRLVVAPLVLVACFLPFRAVLDRAMMLALVTGSSASVAAMVSLFAVREHRDIDLSVALVCCTTLLSILTMPPVIAFAMTCLMGP